MIVTALMTRTTPDISTAFRNFSFLLFAFRAILDSQGEGEFMSRKPCNDCALQFKDACPHPMGNVVECKQFVWRSQFNPRRPNSGRSKPERGEYLDEPTGPSYTTAPAETFRPLPVASSEPRTGMTLYYWDRFELRVDRGWIVWVGANKFGFRFSKKRRYTVLSRSVIGTRLFFTADGARMNARR